MRFSRARQSFSTAARASACLLVRAAIVVTTLRAVVVGLKPSGTPAAEPGKPTPSSFTTRELVLGGAVVVVGFVADFFADLLSGRHWISTGLAQWINTGVTISVVIVFVGGGLWKIRAWTRGKIAWSETLWAAVIWIAFAAVAAFTLNHWKWPAPPRAARAAYFATGAQVDATLLVALAVGAVPAAWRTTREHTRAWIVSGLTVAVIGTAAGLAGAAAAAEGTTSQQILFVLSISPLAPTVVALGIGAFERLERQEGRVLHGQDDESLKVSGVEEQRTETSR